MKPAFLSVARELKREIHRHALIRHGRVIARVPYQSVTIAYRSIVFSVRERLDVLRPVNSASSASDFGSATRMVPSSIRFLSDRTFTRLSAEGNQTLGSPGSGFNFPWAIAMVRAFMSLYDAIPTF